jgi:hypothetical protein
VHLRCLVAIALLTCTPAASEAGLAESKQEFQAQAIGCNNKFPSGRKIARASLVAQQRATAAAEHAAAAQARAAAAQDDISTAVEIGTVMQIMRGFSR